MSANEEILHVGLATQQKFDGVWYPDFFVRNRDELTSYSECDFGDNDVLVASYPKSGTFWMSRIVSLIKNDGDVVKTDQLDINENSTRLEIAKVAGTLAQEEPRIITTHLHYQHLPRSFRNGKGKIICVVRNPKDVSVSFYFFHTMINLIGYHGSFEDFFNLFMQGKVVFGSWSDHVKSFWSQRREQDIFWVSYEELKEDLGSKVAEIAVFLGKHLTEEQVEAIVSASTFSSMKKNPKTNTVVTKELADTSKSQFYRKGIVGDWKEHFTPEMSQQIDQMVEEELAPLGLNMKFE